MRTDKAIFLIGTSHKFQLRMLTTSEVNQESFKSLIEGASIQHCIRLIAEEMSDEIVRKYGAIQTICCEVAAKMPDTDHLLVDPNSEEREQLGIENVDDDRTNIFHDVHMRAPFGADREDIEREVTRMTAGDPRVRASDEKREKEWAHRLKLKNRFPALLVSGADHVQSFSKLAEGMGFIVTVLHADWHPNSPTLVAAPQPSNS